MLSSKSQLSPNQMHQLLKISDYSEQGQLAFLTPYPIKLRSSELSPNAN